MSEEKTKSLMISSTYDGIIVPKLETPDERERREEMLRGEQSKNTRRNYATAWRAFEAWCREKSHDPARATPEIVQVYLTRRLEGGLSIGATTRAYAAIASKMREIGAAGPWDARMRPREIRQLFATAPQKFARKVKKKKPLLPEHFAALGDPVRFDRENWLRSARDRALLLIGFAAGMRRSEIVALDVADLAFDPEGVQIYLKESKTDRRKEGRTIAVPRQKSDRCPVAALDVYLRGARITSGPVFRSFHFRSGAFTERRLCDDAVALIVKEAVLSIGLDPNEYAGHSLRIGLASAAAREGRGLDEIMRQTGHKSVKQVLGYIQTASPYERNAARGLLEDKTK
jgi:integrase